MTLSRAPLLLALLFAAPTWAQDRQRVRLIDGRAHLESEDGRVLPVAHGPWSQVLARRGGSTVRPRFSVEALPDGRALARVTGVEGIDVRRLQTRLAMADAPEWSLVSFAIVERGRESSSVVVETGGFGPLLRQLSRGRDHQLVVSVRMTSERLGDEPKGELLAVEVPLSRVTAVRSAARSDATVVESRAAGALLVTRVRGEWAEVATTRGERAWARVAELLPAASPAAGLAKGGASPATGLAGAVQPGQ